MVVCAWSLLVSDYTASVAFPGIGHLIGGFIGWICSSIIARGGHVEWSISRFPRWDIWRIIITILAVIGLAVVGGAKRFAGCLFGGLAGLAVGVVAIF